MHFCTHVYTHCCMYVQHAHTHTHRQEDSYGKEVLTTQTEKTHADKKYYITDRKC